MGTERETLSHAEVLGRWSGAFADELVACGVRDVCLCPGSRSTPLAVTFARHPAIKVWTHLDERSCAFFALGMAKASGRPVAILCSSGTAAVNFAPAVVEAFHSRVPLIVLTADRPPELQELGANQTIDQHRLYGPAVKWFSHLPLPEASAEMLRYVRMIADRAVATSLAAPQGPVHLDFPFREPLMPASYAFQAEARPRTSANPAALRPALPATPAPLDAERGLIVCGPGTGDSEAVLGMARLLGWPVLADVLSGLRCAGGGTANVIAGYDNFLRVPEVVEALRPDRILRFGEPPTSKPLSTYLVRHRDVPQVVVAPPGTWLDPDLTASEMVYGSSQHGLGGLIAASGLNAANLKTQPEDRQWLQTWQRLDEVTRVTVAHVLHDLPEASEVSAIADLADVAPERMTVFAGNSMPVRDLDGFFPATERRVRFLGSRGASGIDGVVSTALGAAAVSNEPTVLVIGDLSFYHDMNGLLAAQRHGLSATIVLINNDGGGIFSFLPQHGQSEDFETLFGTPHGLDFSYVAPLYGVDFQRVETREQYRAALAASLSASGIQVIEVRTHREENLALHGRIWRSIAEAVEDLVSNEVPAS